jgi:ABC-type cobalt transport system, permease component CbiQ and related transporters
MTTNTYISGTSFYHRLDVRAKLIFTLLCCVLVFLPLSLPSLIILAFLSALLSLFSVGRKETRKSFTLILPVILFMIVFLPLQSRKGTPILSIGSLTLVSDAGIENLLAVMSRFIFISYLATLLLETSTNNALLLGFRYFHLPYSACLALSLTLRFIPSLSSVFSEIRDSQSLRLPNPDEEEAKKRRFASLMPSLTAVLVYAVKSIPITASVLEMRGFGRGEKRTSFHCLPKGRAVFTQMTLCAIMPIVIFTTLEVVL